MTPDEPPYDPDYDTPPPHDLLIRDDPRHDRTPPPQDMAAEQSVLGSMLISTQAITDTTNILTPGDYYRPAHETIHRAIVDLHTDDQPVDPITVAAELGRRGELARIGGPAFLHTLTAVVPIAANASYYAQIVRDLARLRRVDETASRLHQLVTSNPARDQVDLALGDALQTIEDAVVRFSSGGVASTWAPVDLTTVLAGEFLDPPPTMLHRSDGVPLFYDGSVHSVSGESESGKTWLTLIAVVQLLARDRRAVFLDFEDRADRVVSRLLLLGATPRQIQDHFSYIRPDRPVDAEGRRALEPALHGVDLVIIDGVTEAMTMHGLDLNSNEDAAKWLALLPRWITDRGPAVTLIDHVPKDKEQQGRHAIGAQHKLAGIDAAYIVRCIQPFGRGKAGVSMVEVAKDRPGHVREHTQGKAIARFTIDATHGDTFVTTHLAPPTVNSTSETFEPTVLMEKVSRYVQLNPGMSKKTIEGVINGKTDVKRIALELLVTRGYIGVKSGTRGAMQHFHLKPYYQPGAEPDPAQSDPEEDS